MAWLYLSRLPFPEALERVRSGIRKLNAEFTRRAQSSCHPHDPSTEDGYHDTITVAFARVIASRLVVDEPYSRFRRRNPDLFHRPLAIFQYYSQEQLDTEAARPGFVEPDLLPLPAC